MSIRVFGVFINVVAIKCLFVRVVWVTSVYWFVACLAAGSDVGAYVCEFTLAHIFFVGAPVPAHYASVAGRHYVSSCVVEIYFNLHY